MVHINIIFEDDSLAVVEKPAGMPVYPVKMANYKLQITNKSQCTNYKTLAEIAAAKWPSSEPAHRLDNDTSGLVIVAKTKEAFKTLRKQFDDEIVHKEYTALVLGEAPEDGKIDTPITHDPKNKKKMRVNSLRACREDGPAQFSTSPRITGLRSNNKYQEAHTAYKLVKKYLGGRYSLLRVTIKTGVRHQIRVHLASIGHPLAGDRLYQSGRQRERDNTGIVRQFLHATHLGFKHPKSGKWMDLSSPLPLDLDNVLTKIGNI